MTTVLLLDCDQPEGGAPEMVRRPDIGWRVAVADQYALDATPLERFQAVLVSMHSDQRFLAARRDRLDGYLRAGGTLVVGGHVAHPFAEGLQPFRPIEGCRLADLAVNRESEHPVWAGVDPRDLTFRRGVAGFYGRGGHPPPPDARIIHTLGPARMPLDFEYRVGAGRVLFHGGNDLWTYQGCGTTAERMLPQLFAWLEAQP